jgi:hypothetical protein
MHGLHFELDAENLQRLVIELVATEKQVKFALSRALNRTATTLRTMAARSLKNDLQLRTIALLRKRMRSLRLRVSSQEGFTLWFGLNDMPVSWFQGIPKETTTGAQHKETNFEGAFVARSKFKNRKTVFKRDGAGRLPITEQLKAIGDKAKIVIEDEIFVKTEDIFWKHFERDLRARTKHGVGLADYRQNNR